MAFQSLNSLKVLADTFKESDQNMPALFIGHGSPMNTLENNEFTQAWQAVSKKIPVPKAILCISAHWETKGTFVTAMEKPKTIHDFAGFPPALHQFQYPANGHTELAKAIHQDFKFTSVGLDYSWGLDHGTWSILRHLYPDAHIPVLQLSLDYTQNPQYHYDLAKELAGLRKRGILVLGSGNMVHNFQYARFSGNFNAHFGLDWALEANDTFKKLILEKQHKNLIHYQTYSKATALSAPTPEHYLPLLYIIALQEKNEKIEFFNDAVIGASFSMTSVMIS